MSNQTLSEAIYWVFEDFLKAISIYLPKIMAALLFFILGIAIAKLLKRLTIKFLDTIKLSTAIRNTPLAHFLLMAEVKKVENVVGGLVYWLLMLIVLHSTASLLGLGSLSHVLEKVLSYLPKIFSAIIVLVIGILLSGLVESLVKASVRSIDLHGARLIGKISSYLVMSIAILAAVSELGIAQNFILILFIGLVFMLTLGFGLAIGLGAQDLVRKILAKWYQNINK